MKIKELTKNIFTIFFLLFAFPGWGEDLQKAIDEFFPKQEKVFGVKIIGTENTPLEKIKMAANILNQWLDNNNDGNPDNDLLINALIKNNATLIMGQSEDDLEFFLENLIDVLENTNIDIDNVKFDA